ncbi:hypothetical protein HPB51_024435 [Rhipicephalus microplus]|uniref:Uncharacterized protein n=1 Tax=Rhipicephalus microplus TaxID=6941 RepID=A0A9J6D7R1_RHIMP|nr:hypothetical protein HPB51_024435 [Rhipicephalus microplus]
MQCFAGLADLNFWDVTSSDTGSHGSAQSFLAGHVDVTECFPWDCRVSPLWNGTCASAFKLPQFNDRGHPLLDQSFIDNCGTVTSFTTRSIKPLPEDRLFSGLRCKSNSTMFSRCLLFMQVFERHFKPEYLRRTSSYTYLDGRTIKAPMKLTQLTPDALPTIFLGCSAYVSDKEKADRI